MWPLMTAAISMLLPSCSILRHLPPRVMVPAMSAAAAAAAAPLLTRRAPLFSFVGAGREEALGMWERIDDVIMGGVSSSRLVLATDAAGGAIFEGRIREQGGGFCGQRMRLLAEPLDLSSASGIYLDLDACQVGVDMRVLKVAMRTRQDRGEVVYQRAFQPTARGRELVYLPFDEFRLVRGPRLVPGVPPLSPRQANETYQISLVVSKFEVSETGAPLASFKEGPFALRLFEVGTYRYVEGAAGAAAATAADAMIAPAPVPVPRALSEAEQAAAASPLLRILRPVLGLLFGEAVRRRRAATLLLQGRGTGAFGRWRLGWAWRAAGTAGLLGAARTTCALALRDVAALALTLPAQLLFRTVVLVSRAVRWLKARVSGGAGQKAAVA